MTGALETINLDEPDKTRVLPVMEALPVRARTNIEAERIGKHMVAAGEGCRAYPRLRR